MTRGELRQALARFLGLDSTASDGLIALWDVQAIDDAMRELENILNIPRASIVVSQSTLDTNPEVAITDGVEVLQVVAAPDVIVPTLYEEDWADNPNLRPRVARSGLGAVIKQSPLSVMFLKPEGDVFPENVRIVYRKKHVALAVETDEAWGGLYSQFHIVIALHAAMNVITLMDPSEAETPIRYSSLKNQYEKQFERFSEFVDSEVTVFSTYSLPQRRIARW